ncbi:hypothetical protein PSACC_02187 [Paramicrosporidium saccamoebae]|uniref:Rieske domain-containing protein n=1 Tax=Paramicrosporidium saccamoebae TaxID=1246581 RepID=A0A2H9TK56_9FUNG|nr:hypothetical protein PSACC_02187 [Paramicrosporidium saccamoebae]
MSGLWSKGQNALRGLMNSALGNPPRHLVASTNDLQEGQMKEVCIETSGRTFKVLLSRVDGQFHATTHLCPHYKARLVTGVLSGTKLTCPWHAACFDIRSGDIEEAPAVEALRTFPVIVEDESVYVVASMEDFEAGPRKACSAVTTDNKKVYVIVGGGAAGAVAAESIRKTGFKGRVVIVSQETYLAIDRIKLSKFLTANPENIQLYKSTYYSDLKLEYWLGKTVTTVNVQTNEVIMDDGGRLAYDKLLLATGGEPTRIPVSGANLSNVFVIRTIKANRGILEVMEKYPKPKVVVIGANFMGMETAAMMSKASESVTIVAPETVPLERIFGKDVGQVLQLLHERNGVQFRLGMGVKTIHSRDNMAISVELSDGSILEANLVIMATGVRPQTDCVKDVLELRPDGSIAVDQNLKVLGTDNIYAAGDIATFPHRLTRTPTRIEHWNVAQQQGRIAGHNMVSKTPRKYDSVPFFFSVLFGKSVRYAGDVHMGYDAVHFEGDKQADPPVFAAYYIKDEQISAVATMGRDPLAVHCSELLRLGRMPSAASIRAGKVEIGYFLIL